MFVCPSVFSYVSMRIAPDGFSWNLILGLLRKSVEKSQIYLKSDKNIEHFTRRHKCVWYCSQRYIGQQYGQHMAVLPWQHFKYVLHCLQWNIYANNTKRKHFCFSMCDKVTPTHPNITLQAHCLACHYEQRLLAYDAVYLCRNLPTFRWICCLELMGRRNHSSLIPWRWSQYIPPKRW